MVKATLKAPLSAQIEARQHRLSSDVPAASGGGDTAPNPHELLESALAACTTITMQMYALRKQWTIGTTQVQVNTDSEGATSVLSRMITFDGMLAPDQKLKLLEIADRCPIHKLLASSIQIKTDSV